MARIIGGIGTTHVPAIGKAIADGKQKDPYWSPFFRGFDYVQRWLTDERPDVAVVFYNDHGLNFFLDKLPTFAVGAANEYRNEDEGWGIPVSRAARGIPELSWHLIERIRHHHVPGHADRPRAHHSAVADLAGPGRLAGASRADCHQHSAASAAVAGPLSRAWAFGRPGASGLSG
jgi:hypothetical protein